MQSQTKLSKSNHIPFLLPLLGMLAAFPPLSTDMYLPAIPHLVKLWGVDLTTINLTLVCFFLSYSPALLIYGPLSDRFGRKKPLLAGISLFIIGCLLCASAESVQTLIYARILQAVGAAGPSALGFSITKDHYSGPERHKILAMIAIIVSITPMMGPTLGSWVMMLGSWHTIFVLQAAVAIICIFGVCYMPETNTTPRYIPIKKIAGPYLSLFKNPRFLIFTLVFAIVMSPFFAFIAASADIYITGFKISEQAFGLFFGLNALSFMAGSFICMKLVMKLNDTTLFRLGFGHKIIGGLLLIILPHSYILSFTIPMCLIAFGFGLTRPLSVNLILETTNKDTGSTSSLMMFTNFIFAAIIMWFISLCGEWKMITIGFLAVSTSLIALFVLRSMVKKDKD
ncbi:MAG: multidrug effflux MFS transporter [Desulfobacteraceae bacterium]|nr:multidrug effflux MFS transporter [Desulfobacteraceae bacterium]